MKLLFASCCFLIFITGCSPTPQPPVQSTPTVVLQCGKDTDCKGDRICQNGQCANPDTTEVLPKKPGVLANISPPKVAIQDPDPIPVCKAGDGRVKIPVWQPKVDDDGNLSSDPPQKDGQIVYILLFQDASKTTCNDEELNSFSRPTNPKDVMEGGLAVNIKGNTQFASGICYFAGYYMNQDVMGIHQGWIETYFGAIDKKEVIMSGKYCLARKI